MVCPDRNEFIMRASGDKKIQKEGGYQANEVDEKGGAEKELGNSTDRFQGVPPIVSGPLLDRHNLVPTCRYGRGSFLVRLDHSNKGVFL
jgi:hypothetical protein